ncbi:hypothetical protein HanRHA438_Chr08g0356531 [Helianthus annuus]|nr:hypothetical protein HanIR_Chr08g0372371 [Helianthus annuus]KAJ0898415.1 hypothetical protein HanRHA438_Chr08g0356531 [Helianthus annuus]
MKAKSRCGHDHHDIYKKNDVCNVIQNQGCIVLGFQIFFHPQYKIDYLIILLLCNLKIQRNVIHFSKKL